MAARQPLRALYDFERLIPDETKATAYFAEQRRQAPFPCPRCAFNARHVFKKTLFECSQCQRQFSAKAGTIFESSKLPLGTCLLAIFILVKEPGIGSSRLARYLGVMQATAWNLLDRLRRASNTPSFNISKQEEAENKPAPTDEDRLILGILRGLRLSHTGYRWWKHNETLQPAVDGVGEILESLPDVDPADVGRCAAELNWHEDEVVKITQITAHKQQLAKVAAREEEERKKRRPVAPSSRRRSAFFSSQVSSYEYRNGSHYAWGHKI